jgi:hypothetical protein
MVGSSVLDEFGFVFAARQASPGHELDPRLNREYVADAIRESLRGALVVQTSIELVPWGTLQRSEYKSKLVER